MAKISTIPKAFVTGSPIHHSLSPLIHRYWLNFYQLKGDYQIVENTEETFSVFLSKFQEQGFYGGNITLPFKEKAFSLIENCDPIATKIGAVNTVWLENNKLCGSNSDAYGFAANLDDHTSLWAKETAYVLGAGGACRAVIYALCQRGFKRIFLFNRTKLKAEMIANHFGKTVIASDFSSFYDYFKEADLFVNTTSLGMEGMGKDFSFEINFSVAKKDLIVTDLIYTPLFTPFLLQAQQAGLTTIDGLGMLLHQAVPGFAHWFGIQPVVTTELKKHILDYIQHYKS